MFIIKVSIKQATKTLTSIFSLLFLHRFKFYFGQIKNDRVNLMTYLAFDTITPQA